MKSYVKYNQDRWNRVSRQLNPYTIPLTPQQIEHVKQNPLQVSLTVGKTVPLEWFDQAPRNVLLGLACGGWSTRSSVCFERL